MYAVVVPTQTRWWRWQAYGDGMLRWIMLFEVHRQSVGFSCSSGIPP